MRNLLISLLLFGITALPTQAQVEKGQWMVGSQVGNLTFRTTTNFNSFYVNLLPTAGYVPVKGLVIGTGIPLYIAGVKSSYGGEYYNHSSDFNFGLAPFVRYYISKSPFKPYVGMSYSYTRITGGVNSNLPTTGYNTGQTKGHSSTISPEVGVAYFINTHVGFALNASYNIIEGSQSTTSTVPPLVNSYLDTDRNLLVSIALTVFL